MSNTSFFGVAADADISDAFGESSFKSIDEAVEHIED
jgi:hypothetical protein